MGNVPFHQRVDTPKEAKKKAKRRNEKSEQFYNSTKWRRFSKRNLAKNPFCAICQNIATDSDHIERWQEGGDKFNPDNIQSLCKKCHGLKSWQERQNQEEE